MSRVMSTGLVALALAACGQNGSSVQYHADGGQTVRIADAKNGNLAAEIGASAQMPKDLPAWAAAYPGSTVVMAQTHQQANGTVENVVLQTSDALPTVAAFYDRKIAAAGLTPMHAVSSADVSVRLVTTPAGIIGVTASKIEEGGSTVSITRMPKE